MARQLPMHRDREKSAKMCTLCQHPQREYIDFLLSEGAGWTVTDIRMKVKERFPDAPELPSDMSFSRHKQHYLDQRDETKLTNVATGQSLTIQRLVLPAEAFDADSISLPDALNVVIAAGISNILKNPGRVTPTVLVQAMELKAKLGMGGSSLDDFTAAWAGLDEPSTQPAPTTKKRVTRKVSIEETVESGSTAPEGDVIEGEIVPDAPQLPPGWGTGETIDIPAAPAVVKPKRKRGRSLKRRKPRSDSTSTR